MTTLLDKTKEVGRFRMLAKALEATGLDRELTEHGPFTLFAPDDDAFSKIPYSLREELMSDIPRLRKIIEYHVASGAHDAEEVRHMISMRTVEGEDVSVRDLDGIYVNDAKVIRPDIKADNGVIHEIDTVLMPR
ncbi:MAG: fasciclin domain-containing protein [Phycisphaerae bacterium]